MELYEDVKGWLNLSESPVQQKQKLFAGDGPLILKDKLSNIERSTFTSLCKIHQEQGIISGHDRFLVKPIFAANRSFAL